MGANLNKGRNFQILRLTAVRMYRDINTDLSSLRS